MLHSSSCLSSFSPMLQSLARRAVPLTLFLLFCVVVISCHLISLHWFSEFSSTFACIFCADTILSLSLPMNLNGILLLPT